MSGGNTHRSALPVGHILIGDARQHLAALPAASVDCVITSPPYFGLRDYGHDEQLGLEGNVEGWVDNLAGVCDEIARVLKPTGALWLNVGDGYSNHERQGTTKKSLLLGPQRLAIALSQRGWILRNQIVWAKTNPMPSSVRDRLSPSYEVILLCVRSRRYYFDLDAIREPHLTPTQPKRPTARGYQYLPDGAVPAGTEVDLNHGLSALKAKGLVGHPLGRNPGDVWRLPTAAYHGAHFATFPTGLIEKPLLATCPEKVCQRCGTPWQRRPVERQATPAKLGALRTGCDCRAAAVPGVVLDPFMGAGTTALAAERHGRQWVGIELNPAFAALARERLADWRATQHKTYKETTP